MRSGWLLRDDEVLAAADITEGLTERVRGFAGRHDPHIALVLQGMAAAHTLGAGEPVDAAYLDRQLRVLAIVRLAAWRVAWPRPRCRTIVQVHAGTFARWDLQVGDQLEIRLPA